MSLDVALATQIVTGSTAVLGGLLTAWMRNRTKALEAEQENDRAILQSILGKQEALEFQLAASNRREGEMTYRINELEKAAVQREMALHELTFRYESLREDYNELAERHRVAEAENRHMRDQVLLSYISSDGRKSAAPPPHPDSTFRRGLPPNPYKK